MKSEGKALLPLVKIDLAKLAAYSAAGLREWQIKPDDLQLALDLRGWREEDGWWAAPSENELRRVAHAVTVSNRS